MARSSDYSSEKRTELAYIKLTEDLKDQIQVLADNDRRSFAEMAQILLELAVHVHQFKLKPRPFSSRTLNQP